jgi:rfaE bifunctional protein nucleotidyltransferase chain/domain
MQQKIVLTGGCFDILHIGHVRFLKKAKSFGNYLIVLLESDENIKKIKGKNRPFHKVKERRETLEALRSVDKVIVLPELVNDKTYDDLIKKIKPSSITVTEDDPLIYKKLAQAKSVGAKLNIVKKYKSNSTTSIKKLL